MSKLRQMEEFERALAMKEASKAAISQTADKPTIYRDRAKERRESFSDDSSGYSGVKSARDINGNLDWRCGGCKKLNFARTIFCISCSKPVDQDTEYLDSSDHQAKRHQGIMKLARLHDSRTA